MDREIRRLAAELIDCLKRQADGLNQFLELLARQKTALVSRNANEVDVVALEIEQALAFAKGLENTRKGLTCQLIDCLRKSTATAGDLSDTETATLTELFGLVAASEASELAAIQARLRGLHREIERRRSRNARLVEASLECTGDPLSETRRSTPRRAAAGTRSKSSTHARSRSSGRS